MERTDLKTEILKLLSSPSYMPMRKRGLAKELGIDEEEYRSFKELLAEMSDEGTIAELKKGNGGSTAAAGRRRATIPGIRPLNAARTQPIETATVRLPPSPARKRASEEYAWGASTSSAAAWRICSSDPPGHDLFIAQEDVSAMNSDLVAVEMKRREERESKRRGKFFAAAAVQAGRRDVVRILDALVARSSGPIFHTAAPNRCPRRFTAIASATNSWHRCRPYCPGRARRFLGA